MSASIKEHKWVNNHGQPPSKRRRINAACLTCRKRKTRCAGEKPVCSTCSKNGHRCLGYNEVEDKKNVSLKAEPENNCGGLSHTNIKQERQESFVFYSAKGAREDNKVDVWKNESFKQPMAGFVDAGSLSRQDSISSATVASSAFSLRRKRSDELDGGDHSSGSSYTEDGKSTANQSSVAQQHQDEQDSLRVPYFRYFGPTAIVPGHKQMLVDLAELSQSRERRKSRGGSFSSTSPVSIRARYESVLMEKHEKQVQQQQSQLDGELHTLAEVHPYDMDDDEPPHKLVVLLVSTFFKNLGSNFRFLKEKRTMRLLQEKRLEPILVDAMCALAARFLDLPVFSNEHDGKKKRSEYGYVFAQRAKAATVDTFPCPSVAAVQACLLMAYEGFGANQDSSLWMYLGLAIRMAVDLGLQKTEGVKFRGEQDPWYTRSWSRDGQEEADHQGESEEKDEKDDSSSLERRAIEQERIDTFWAVFVLDRVISSGTGRPVTFRDTDFDLDFPQRRELPGPSGLPDPFPAFVEVVHLYGRVSDILNNIKCGADLDEDNFATLRLMEIELTALQQRHPGLLYFNPVHFQAYSAMGLGATFLLLHFWFHALVIILHQPTMLNEKWNVNPPTLLKPNSRELSLSSAKSIADILTVSELINFPSFIGNPFTSQPIYIAACAFLVETGALKSHPPSRAQSPHLGVSSRSLPWLPGTTDDIQVTRHSLLASAASENYKNCYHALVALQYYWGGVEYIITALDQKSKGIWDCETFNVDEYEAIKQARRAGPLSRFLPLEFPASPGPGLRPFACSLTGTTNSPNPAVTTLLYPKGAPAITQLHQTQPLSSVPISNATPPGYMPYDPIRQSLPDTPSASSAMFVSPYPQAVMSAVRHQPHAAKLPSSFRSTAKSMLKYESLSSGDTDHNGISHSPSANNHPSYGSESSQDESPLSGKLLTSDEINSSGSSGSSNELDNIVQQENQDRSDVNIYSNDYDHDFSQGLLEMNHNMQFGGGGYNPLYMGETFAVNTQEVDFDSLGFPGNLGHWGVDPEAFISNMSSLFEGGVLTMQPNFHYM